MYIIRIDHNKYIFNEKQLWNQFK